MTILDDLKNFDIADAELTLWVFKKSTPIGRPPRYTGRYLDTTDDLDLALKEAVTLERDRIEEFQNYGLLTQNNEGSALSIGTIETHAGLIVDQTAAETPQKKADKLTKVQNSAFYVIKLVSGETVIQAVRKTDASWRVRKTLNAISVFFADEQLGIDTTPTLYISRHVDFFIVDDSLLISNKANFESILSYKQAHKEDFDALQAEPEFIEIFASVDAFVSYVGENKIQLRRASAIRQKGHYKDVAFMTRLKARYTEFRLNIQFDNNGRILSTEETCKDIFQALLDHRLSSAFSETIYDVPDAQPV